MEMEVIKAVGMGLATLGMIGAPIGVGLVFAGLLQGISRNPSAAKQMIPMAFVGAALAEIMGFLAFVVAIMASGL
jgi:F-type H+-transporting ATPase subunit c